LLQTKLVEAVSLTPLSGKIICYFIFSLTQWSLCQCLRSVQVLRLVWDAIMRLSIKRMQLLHNLLNFVLDCLSTKSWVSTVATYSPPTEEGCNSKYVNGVQMCQASTVCRVHNVPHWVT
jgi:hypothetical protein